MRNAKRLSLSVMVALGVSLAAESAAAGRDSTPTPQVGPSSTTIAPRIITTTTTTSTTTTPPPKIRVDWSRWQRLHNCEQGNTWYANGHNPRDPAHQTFQGGLGMSTVAWKMATRAAGNRGVVLPSSALNATPQQQMTGAQAFYDRYGWGWACHV